METKSLKKTAMIFVILTVFALLAGCNTLSTPLQEEAPTPTLIPTPIPVPTIDFTNPEEIAQQWAISSTNGEIDKAMSLVSDISLKILGEETVRSYIQEGYEMLRSDGEEFVKVEILYPNIKDTHASFTAHIYLEKDGEHFFVVMKVILINENNQWKFRFDGT